MKIKITWNDRTEDIFEVPLSKEEIEEILSSAVEDCLQTVISVGNPAADFYFLGDARKLEVYE